MKTQIPIKKNEYYEMDINGLGHEGEGVGKIEGFTVFVPYALPGDQIRVKILSIKSSFAFGKLVEILNPSVQRVTPMCPIFLKCGGCQLQHLSYQKQLMLKQQTVIDNLQRIGKLQDVCVHNTIGMAQPVRYRNKAQFPVGEGNRANEIQVGFYAPKSHRIIEMDTCYIQHEMNDTIIQQVKQWMQQYKVKPYNEEKKTGFIRHIFTRVGVQSGEIMVVLVTNGCKFPHSHELVELLRISNQNIVSVIQNINTKETNVILGHENKVLWGKDHIIDYIENIQFAISPLSFYQVNPIQTEILYNKALEYAALEGNETVFDIYCGIGTISLFFAQKAKKVIGVEIVSQAVEDAKKNAAINHITNAEFYVGAAEKVIPELYEQEYKADVVVVDPPRKGCDEALLYTIVKMQVEKIVYVSCNPSTLARDLRYLEDHGYRAVEVQPVDMFPYTAHVETVVLMSRKDK